MTATRSALVCAFVAATVGLAAATNCMKPDGTMAPCGPGNDQCGAPFVNAPKFHVMDKSCGENDPNGPVYDPVHGVYHLFYQDHLAMGAGHGPIYGHAVSRDFAHWAHLPVGIWNDQPYDNEAIFTGSATVVDGKVVQVYPGLCNKQDWPSCSTGTNLAVAVPADPVNDPLYVNWTKPAYNPIWNGSQRDPSTAWQTPDGEWRLTTFDTNVYGSMDFKSWYLIGPQPGFPHGECPSFFPLPATTPGAGPAPAGAGVPTHVHKSSHSGDWMQVGTYVAGPPKSNGSWNATPGVDLAEVKIDMGNFYASKDFYDPVKKRRINWGWAQVPPASTQTLPRVLTWNPELQQLVFSPAEEQDSLRGTQITKMSNQPVGANTSISLGNWSPGVGNQSDIEVVFDRPAEPAIFGVIVMAGADQSGSGKIFYVNYVPPTASDSYSTVTVGAADMPFANGGHAPYAKEMPNYDLPGDDYNVTNVDYKDFHVCEAACNADTKCQAWTYVVRPPKYASCCLKTVIPADRPAQGMTSGVKNPNDAPSSGGGPTDHLKLSPTDKTISIRVFVDNTFAEAYWQDGRVAMTMKLSPTPEAKAGVYSANGAVNIASASAYQVQSIWVSPEEVLKTPRLDGKAEPQY